MVPCGCGRRRVLSTVVDAARVKAARAVAQGMAVRWSQTIALARVVAYPGDRVPELWSRLRHMTAQATTKQMPLETCEEITHGSTDIRRDLLHGWITEPGRRDALVRNRCADVAHVRRVLRDGYAPDLTDAEVEAIGADPFLIACALADWQARCVVTTEASKPTARRGNRRIPDVCKQFGVPCINTFELVRVLDFRTSWSPDPGNSRHGRGRPGGTSLPRART